MTAPMHDWPVIRLPNTSAGWSVRDGFVVAFFVHRPHADVASTILAALEEFGAVMGERFPRWYVDEDGFPAEWSAAALEHLRRRMAEWPNYGIDLIDAPNGAAGVKFHYDGREEGGTDGAVSALAVWLPTEIAAERGIGFVQSLATRLAQLLPFSHGYASLAFNRSTGAGSGAAFSLIRRLCFNYPGMDVHRIESDSREIGNRIRGAYWLNFFGADVLAALGGATAFDGAQLDFTALGEGKILVATGEVPSAGNVAAGVALPRHRALAAIVEPLLYRSSRPFPSFTAEETAQWERRFF